MRRTVSANLHFALTSFVAVVETTEENLNV